MICNFSSIRVRLGCVLACLAGVGCSSEPSATLLPTSGSDSAPRIEQGHLASLTDRLPTGLVDAMQDPLGLGAEDETLPDDLLEPIVANQVPAVPFPERSDPFEFGKGVDFDNPQVGQGEAQNIQLYGFAGAEHPKAILHVDGKTKMLSAGEKWGALEILEVSPPTVRIRANGVIRVWSLLGHREQSTL
jgi:hypothetical protein